MVLLPSVRRSPLVHGTCSDDREDGGELAERERRYNGEAEKRRICCGAESVMHFQRCEDNAHMLYDVYGCNIGLLANVLHITYLWGQNGSEETETRASLAGLSSDVERSSINAPHPAAKWGQ